jgi:signal transduction histidine kinase
MAEGGRAERDRLVIWHRPMASADSNRTVVRAVGRFALTGAAALVLLAFVAVRILQHVGRSEAVRDAQVETRLAGEGVVAPALPAGLLDGGPAAIARVDRLVRGRVLRDPVVRVKIWNGRGRILYSDERRLIGATYTLGPDELRALRTGGVDAEVSDLAKPENRFERSYGKLLEVYLGIRGPHGSPLLYEDYLRYGSVAASANRLWSRFAPALLVSLVALELLQIPSAWSLAQRVRRGQHEREVLLRRAIDASELERRRIAGTLHDGVVQTLAGVSYSLSAASGHLGEHDARAAAMIDRAASDTRQSIRELRSLLVDIYPPALQQAGLKAALSDLLAPLEARDVSTRLDVPSRLELSTDAESVLYRVAQEALRNVAKHARARHVTVRAAREDGHALLSVEDDGLGFASTAADGPPGHFGLRIMRDLARDAGGRLTVDTAPDAGTRIRLEVPA